ncbi:hypothetical protein B0H19DRAFT_1275216 [Mycena capillaripes]|nr:hypothetical protein B0H19DRAFT_1275216 [Mycena capillaripes]
MTYIDKIKDTGTIKVTLIFPALHDTPPPPRGLGCLHSLSDDLRELDRLPEALPVAEERVQISREISQSEPHVFTSSLAESLCYLSYVLRDLGRDKDSFSAIEEAVSLQRNMSENDPTVLADLAFSIHHMSFVLRDSGKLAESLASAENALSIRRRLAVSNPSKFNPLLAQSLNGLSLALRAGGRHDDALVQAQEAVAIQQQLVQEDSKTFKPDLVGLLNTVSYHLSAVHKLDDALRTVEQAIEMQRELVEADPSHYGGLANILDTRANVLCSLGRHDEALRTVSEAEDINGRNSTDPERLVRERSAVYLGTRCKCLVGCRQPAESLNAISAALESFRTVAKQTPSVISPVFSESIDAILGALLELNSTSTALDSMVEVVDLCRILYKDSPGRFGRTLRKALL